MGFKVRILLLLVSAFAAPALAGRAAEDEISFKSVRVNGTLKERSVPAWTPLTVEVTKKNATVTVQLDFGDDEKLREKAAKLAGQRVVVEGRGEYRLISTKVIEQLSLFVVVEKVELAEAK